MEKKKWQTEPKRKSNMYKYIYSTFLQNYRPAILKFVFFCLFVTQLRGHSMTYRSIVVASSRSIA